MSTVVPYLAVAMLIFMGGYVFRYGFLAQRRMRLVQDVPTAKIRSLALGLAEIKGEIAARQTVRAPFSGAECVYYHYTIYRRVTRQGRPGQELRSAGSGQKSVPFEVRDETGGVLVDPRGAEIERPAARRAFVSESNHKPSLMGQIKSLKAMDEATFKSGERPADIPDDLVPVPEGNLMEQAPGKDRYYVEATLGTGDHVYVMGTATPGEDGEPVIRRGPREHVFLISEKGERDFLAGLKQGVRGGFLFGGAMIVGGVLLLLHLLGAF